MSMKKENTLDYSKITATLMKTFNYKSVMQVPKVEKVVINMGVGDAIFNVKVLDDVVEELKLLSGQIPVITKAKKAISNFKLREGMPIGAKVTLRGARKEAFLYKLTRLVFPRVRDFRGISGKSFDGRGNYALGLKEQIVFPEINIDKVKKIRGMDIIIVTTAKNNTQAKKLLELYGMPFKN
ncbi:50S ribosomal protein L5 [Hydrangea phyllody phytoplasma]|uniref:Large ribosomal subunit protein uL5 n=2 Tax=16SrI (Aster yellows group) TaxID=3042590 RepID=A0ABQ5PTG8_9MOLU|nr:MULTISPECIES: 50S ribosomal protein L5 [16SrI (Aster yellows group)]GFZ75359.1 50S ribosomal protein L5 [Hydrangea phyllody phytoplasma]GLH61360.1 50S ribosomal protein L5 [Rhus yellows phytoplasma]GLH61631.1 50S ribosomal protein L5 [Hydrangea phyllody phytoplasma]